MARFDLDAELSKTDKLLNLPAGFSRAQMQVESGFDPRAVSPAGAQGLAQVMPATLSSLSKRFGRDLDPFNPSDAVQIQREVMRENLSKFKDPAKALMAYNGGWDESKWNNPETQAYVGKVRNAMRGGSMMADAADKVFSAVSGTAQAQTPTDSLPAKVKQAREAGYSDDEIFAHLSKSQGFASKLQQAKDAGYNDDEIRQYFGLKTAAPAQSTTKPEKPEEPGMLATGAKNFVKGAAQGVKQDLVAGPAQFIGNAIQGAIGLIPGIKDTQYYKDITANSENMNRLMRADEQKYQAETPGSVAAGAGRLGANLVGFLGAGGGNAVSGGGRGGEAAVRLLGGGPGAQAAGKLAGQSVGSAGLGALTGALAPVTEEGDYTKNKLTQIGTGAAVGAVMPGATQLVTGAGRRLGSTVRALVDPFTESGQNRIAGNLLNRFAEGGPMTPNTATLVQGSSPTLAQATGNPGLASLERGLQASNPAMTNALSERAGANAEARLAAAQKATGTQADLASAISERASNAADDYLKTHIGIPVANTEYSALKETPAFKAAFNRAQAMARNAGTSLETTTQNRANANLGGAAGRPETYVSGQGLQIIKEALDDQINKAAQAGAKKQASNLLGVKDKLLTLMDREIPGYSDARAAYAEASRPIDAMRYLQSLNLTDAQGNITLAKVQNALKNVQKQRALPGVRDAKSVTQEQIDALSAIRDDLLRGSQSFAGKPLGSNTFQNLATNNIIEQALPAPVRALMGGTSGPVSNLAGKAGNLLYSGANEQIQNRLMEMMMSPQSGLNAIQNVSRAQAAGPLGGNLLLQRLAPNLLPAAVIGATGAAVR